MILSWHLNLILSLGFSVVFFQCYKIAVKRSQHDGAATIVLQAIAGGTMLAILPFFELRLPDNPKIYFLLLLACVFYAITDRLQTTVRKHMEVSAYSILGQLSNVFLIVFGFLFFKEPLVASKIAGAALIIGGNVLLQYRNTTFVFDRYVGLAILGGLALATALSIDIGNAQHMTLPLYISVTFLIPALIIFISERIPLTIIKQGIQHLNMKYTLFTGFSWAGAIFFLLRAYQTGSVATTVSLQATLVLWNVLFAFIIFQERTYLFQKVIAACLVVAGIILTV